MPKQKCEQCGKEFDTLRKHPFCCYQCFRLAETKRKNVHMEYYKWLMQQNNVYYPRYLQQAKRESLQWQFEKQVKKEVMKGSHKAFQEDGITNENTFLQYVLDTVRVRRE